MAPAFAKQKLAFCGKEVLKWDPHSDISEIMP